MTSAVERHLALMHTAIEKHHGVLFKIVGDAVQAGFPAAPDAVAAALDGKRSLATEQWSAIGGSLTVRMAVYMAAATPPGRDRLAISSRVGDLGRFPDGHDDERFL